MTGAPVRRIGVLWEHLTGYTQAFLDALLARGDGLELLVVQGSSEPHARYAAYVRPRATVVASVDDDLPRAVASFAPDVTIVTSNANRVYATIARAEHERGGVVIWASDVPARSTARDAWAMARGRSHVVRNFDAALVAGARAAEFAHRIGFSRSRIFTGLYSCDTNLFRRVGVERFAAGAGPWPRRFLFLGQFIARKGIETLIAAYRDYRRTAAEPWELCCVGAGPLTPARDQGIRVLDFQPPAECATLMREAGALVLPSRLDHWGVVLHEATCAGLPVLATRTCHATTELVQDGVNGYLFDSGDARRLSSLMREIDDADRARAMGERSLHLSYRFDPAVTAALVADYIPRLIRGEA
jgi:glycosyltransferase involved in cell wall biosynthesis